MASPATLRVKIRFPGNRGAHRARCAMDTLTTMGDMSQPAGLRRERQEEGEREFGRIATNGGTKDVHETKTNILHLLSSTV